jgi:hypothetical protein
MEPIMAKSPAEYIALNPKGKSDAFRTAYADMEDLTETYRETMRTLGETLLAAALADGFVIPPGMAARVVASRFDGKLQIMLTEATTQRKSF